MELIPVPHDVASGPSDKSGLRRTGDTVGGFAATPSRPKLEGAI